MTRPESAESGSRSTGAIVPERQRCICPDDVCLDHCRACNWSGRDLEEACIADPDWHADECAHDWMLHPESDHHECLICGEWR